MRKVTATMLVLVCVTSCGELADAQPTTPEPVAPAEPVVAQPPPPEDPNFPRDLAYIHPEVGAFGTIDLTQIREHAGFGDLIVRTLAGYGVPAVSSAAVVRLLRHTSTMSGTLAYGPGESAVLATLLLRGEYGPTEVPDAFHDILPSLARGLWHPTRIEGHRAFDLGMAALIEVEPGAWLISRRIDGNLALGGRDRVPAALREEVVAAKALLTPGTGFGALIGPRATVPGNSPPSALDDLFHGPSHGVAALRFDGQRAVVELDVTLHHRSDANRWAEAYRGWMSTFAADLHVPPESVTHRIDLEGTVLHGHIELEAVAVDAFVARLVGGRLLTTPPVPPVVEAPNESPTP